MGCKMHTARICASGMLSMSKRPMIVIRWMLKFLHDLRYPYTLGIMPFQYTRVMHLVSTVGSFFGGSFYMIPQSKGFKKSALPGLCAGKALNEAAF